MVPIDFRGVMLHNLDARADALKADCAMGSAGADSQILALVELAAAMHQSLTSWRPIVQRLQLLAHGGFDAPRAGALIIESVFDELLAPAACRCLGAAFELAAMD